MTNTDYTLWLAPAGNAYRKLHAMISMLSRTYKTPLFEPHVTLLPKILLSEEGVIKRTAGLAKQLGPYEIKLSKPGFTDHYLKCLFLHVEMTKEVMQANRIARNVFDMDSNAPYEPHLSLMYGNISRGEKEKIIKDLADIEIRFKVNSIGLYLFNRDDTKWAKVREFNLED